MPSSAGTSIPSDKHRALERTYLCVSFASPSSRRYLFLSEVGINPATKLVIKSPSGLALSGIQFITSGSLFAKSLAAATLEWKLITLFRSYFLIVFIRPI